jgi:hypothetical protein
LGWMLMVCNKCSLNSGGIKMCYGTCIWNCGPNWKLVNSWEKNQRDMIFKSS